MKTTTHDRKQQNRNKKNNKFISFQGKTLCLGEWAEIVGIHPGAISKRLIRGWSVEKALTQPVRVRLNTLCAP